MEASWFSPSWQRTTWLLSHSSALAGCGGESEGKGKTHELGYKQVNRTAKLSFSSFHEDYTDTSQRYSMARTNTMDSMGLCRGNGWAALQSMARCPGAPSIAQLGKLPKYLSLICRLEERC